VLSTPESPPPGNHDDSATLDKWTTPAGATHAQIRRTRSSHGVDVFAVSGEIDSAEADAVQHALLDALHQTPAPA
jgi:hypothetical protein